jgi:hypothetical protein
MTFGDSIKYRRPIASKNASVHLNASYNLPYSFFAYGEWKRSMPLTKQMSDRGARKWVNNYLVGVGRKFLVHPKIYLTVTTLYCLQRVDKTPVYTGRFQIRTGFQLSELATRKKKIYYDPD